MDKKLIKRAAETAGVFVITFIIAFFNIFGSIDKLLQDKLYQIPRQPDSKIKIIAIDDKSLSELGPFDRWSRENYARLIEAIGDYPAVISIDVMFMGETDKAGDESLKAACEKYGNVITGSYINYTSVYTTDENGNPYINHYNFEKLDLPVTADFSRTGFVNAYPDNDGIVRSVLLTASAPSGEKINSLAMETYLAYCEKTGTVPNMPPQNADSLNIHYAGEPGDYEHISFSDVLSGKINPKIFTDCIVYVGAYATGLRDQFSVPASPVQMNGVEINANITQALLDNIHPRPADRLSVSVIAAALAALAYIVFRKIPFKASLPISLILAAGYIGTAIFLNDKGVTMPIFYVPTYIILVFLVNLGVRYVKEMAERRKITSVFKKYVAPQVVDEITRTGSYHIKLGGENRNIAVLFVDIRGFTPMSESLEPEQVVDILNNYLNLTTNAIFNNGGTLDKFIGDATMAVFNAPFDLDDYIYRAVKTAWDIVSGGNAIESQFLEKYGKSVSFGVGVNCGPAVVGNIGCNFRMDYTAIGDTVNTAARLESNAKRGQVLISSDVYEAVKDRITAEPIGEIPLKGKSKGVFVYSLTGLNEENQPEG